MSKRAFTEEEIIELSKNPYIKHVGEKGITYTKEFKEYFIQEINNGKRTTKIFFNAGFNTKLIGRKRMDTFAYRVKYKDVEDTRKGNSGRSRIHDKKELTDEETIKLLRHKNAFY